MIMSSSSWWWRRTFFFCSIITCMMLLLMRWCMLHDRWSGPDDRWTMLEDLGGRDPGTWLVTCGHLGPRRPHFWSKMGFDPPNPVLRMGNCGPGTPFFDRKPRFSGYDVLKCKSGVLVDRNPGSPGVIRMAEKMVHINSGFTLQNVRSRGTTFSGFFGVLGTLDLDPPGFCGFRGPLDPVFVHDPTLRTPFFL